LAACDFCWMTRHKLPCSQVFDKSGNSFCRAPIVDSVLCQCKVTLSVNGSRLGRNDH
jgi:hypothetical protein